MNDRYFARVIHVIDKYNLVIDAGSNGEVEVGMKFLIVGLGDLILDPESNEEIERLELIRGRAEVMHVQEKISTLRSIEFERRPDTREIKKVTSRSAHGLASLIGAQDVVTESIKPSEPYLLEFNNVEIGDYAIII